MRILRLALPAALMPAALMPAALMPAALMPLALVPATPLHADDLNAAFENAPSNYWTWGKGRNSTGKAEISTEKARSGTSSTKISFRFTDEGWIEFLTAQSADIQGDVAYVSLWATGLKTDDFAGSAIRFTDKDGETFQYEFHQLVEAATSANWKEARAKIDLTQPKINWGNNADGILDKPIRFSGFGLTRKRATSGALFIDDLKISESEIPTSVVPTVAAQGVAPVTATEAEAVLTIKNGSISGGEGTLKFVVAGAAVPAPNATTFAHMMREGKTIDVSSDATPTKWRIEPLAEWRDALPLDSQRATDSDSKGRLEKSALGARATLSYSATAGKNNYVQFPITVDLPRDAEAVGAVFKTNGPTPLAMAVRTRDERNEFMGFVLGTNENTTTRALQTPNYRWGAPDSKTSTAAPQGQLKTFGLILEATDSKFAGDTQAEIESLYLVRRLR